MSNKIVWMGEREAEELVEKGHTTLIAEDGTYIDIDTNDGAKDVLDL